MHHSLLCTRPEQHPLPWLHSLTYSSHAGEPWRLINRVGQLGILSPGLPSDWSLNFPWLKDKQARVRSSTHFFLHLSTLVSASVTPLLNILCCHLTVLHGWLGACLAAVSCGVCAMRLCSSSQTCWHQWHASLWVLFHNALHCFYLLIYALLYRHALQSFVPLLLKGNRKEIIFKSFVHPVECFCKKTFP